MIKTIINKAVRAVLDELFVDAPSVQLSMGADLFSDSKINLSNLTFRPDIFDISLQPFHLIHGHVGSLNIEGIAELALGGKLRFNAQNIYLLFEIDELADPEKIQNMKKILLELQSSKFSNVILSDLLKRIQGLPTSPDNDILKKRKALYKAFDYLSKGIFLTIQSIHIRFEFKGNSGSSSSICNALGVMMPMIKIVPAPASMRPDNVPRNDPVFLLGLKSTQLYCDYQRESYRRDFPQRIVDQFTTQWKQEIHSALISPFDLDFVVGLNIKRRTGLICPNVVIKFPLLKLSVDERQLEVLNQIAHELVMGSKKFSHAVKVQKIFRNGFPLPKVQEVGGIRLLPHLFFKNQPYPLQYKSIPRSNGIGIVSFMKERVGARWTQMLWKHLIRLVIHDLQKARPLGRWVELVRLSAIRKDYSFLYAQYFKKSGEGNYVFNPHAPIPATKVRQLFEYEMMLSEQAVSMFRSLAYMIAVAGFFYNKKRQLVSTNGSKPPAIGEGVPGWEKIFIGWREILRIDTELSEAQRETAFHRFDRSRQDDNDADDPMLWDENATVRSSEEGSVYSYSMHSMTSAKGPPSPTKLAKGKLPTESTTPSAKVTPTGIQSTAKKFFGNWNLGGITSAFTPADDYDRKIMGKFDLSVFHDILGSIVESENKKPTEKDIENAFTISNEIEMALRRGPTSPKAIIPEISCIAEAVQWSMLKHQDVITWMPPDINLQIDKINIELKSPLSFTQKERIPIASLKIVDLSANVNISQSSSSSHTFNNSKKPTSSAINGTPGKNSFEERVKSLRGFASLSGALIQFRLVCRQFSVGLHLLPPVSNVDTGIRTMTGVIGQQGNGIIPSLGLPSYPIGDAASSTINTTDTALTLKRIHSSDSLHSASSSESTSNHTSSVYQHSTRGGAAAGDQESQSEEQQGRASATTISTAADNKTEETLELKTIPGVNPQVKYIPGETIMESMQRIKDYKFMHGIVEKSDDEKEEDDEEDEEVSNTNRPGGVAKKSTGSKGYTIDTAFDDTASAATAGKKSSNSGSATATPAATGTSVDIKDIISSAPAENAFVFCVILDLDDKGEGAGDIQLQLGGMRLDLSKRIMATLIHPSFADHFLKVLKEKAEMDNVLLLLNQPMVVIDWDQNTPEVLLSCDPPLSVLDRLLEQEELVSKKPQPKTSTSNASRKEPQRSKKIPAETLVLIDDSHESYGEDDEQANQEAAENARAESLSERRKRRAAIAFNKNFMQWMAVLESSLPKILSFCLRTSPVIVQSLESTVIRDLVYAKIQSVLDRASKRRQENGLLETLPIDHIWGMLSHLVMSGFDNSEENVEFNNRVTAYRRMRRWGARAAVTSVYPRKLNFGGDGNTNGASNQPAPQSAFKLKILIPAIELVLAKAIVPYPALDVHIQSMNVMKLPMSDETLCYYLAWMLAEFMPIYF